VKRDHFLLLLITLIFIAAGCVPPPIYTPSPAAQIVYTVQPESVSANNEYFEATITPQRDYEMPQFYTSFLLTVKNKTAKDLELDWNRTLFIQNNETKGGFMFEGVVYSKRDEPKPPDIIFANSTFNKSIYPNIRVYYLRGSGFGNGELVGDVGAYLVIKAGDKEVNEKLVTKITKEIQ